MKSTLTLVADRNNNVWTSKKGKYWVTEDGSRGCGRETLERSMSRLPLSQRKEPGNRPTREQTISERGLRKIGNMAKTSQGLSFMPNKGQFLPIICTSTPIPYYKRYGFDTRGHKAREVRDNYTS